MKCFLLSYCLLLNSLVSISFQASVNPNCSTPLADTLCHTVAFTRSVLEGHDVFLDTDSDKDAFQLTIYANTPYTNLLLGYNVNIEGGCAYWENITASQAAPTAPDTCLVDVTRCTSTMLTLFLKADSSTISGNLFYTTIEMALPKENFQVKIVPSFANGPDTVYDAVQPSGLGSFTPTPIEDAESTWSSTECTVYIPPGVEGGERRIIAASGKNSIIIIAVFVSLLLIAAVLIKVCAVVTASKKSSVAGTPQSQMELGGPSGADVGETFGSYSQQRDM